MQIERAFRDYREGMIRAMTSFSRDEQAALDAVSHAFTKALGNKLFLENMPEPAMKAWLYAAARNALVDIKRREKRLGPLPEEELPEEHQIDLADRVTIAALLVKLPPALRKPIQLKYFERMNAAEIGRAMRLNAATVRTRIRTAIGMMRGIMQGTSYEVPGVKHEE
jgi:RNA polymerase sigma-70 factor (ECF subfamily)